MDVAKLDEDELTYELRARGIAAMDGADEMRSVLRGLLRMEVEGRTVLLADGGCASADAKSEVKTCVKKLQVIDGMIDGIRGDRYGEAYRAADAKLCHLMNRVDRLPAVEPQDKRDRSSLLKGVLFLMRKMEEMASSDGTAVAGTSPNGGAGKVASMFSNDHDEMCCANARRR